MNAEWHEMNVMPKNASIDERIAWHTEHQNYCGCRPIPASVKKAMAVATPTAARRDLMTPRRVTVFFYGLFMDADVLRARGVEPRDIRLASVPEFALRVGRRATLVPVAGERAHGVVMELMHDDIDRLYDDPSVHAYRPEAVLTELPDGSRVPALCYNLVVPPTPGEADAEYAGKLRELARRMKLPADYVERIGRG